MWERWRESPVRWPPARAFWTPRFATLVSAAAAVALCAAIWHLSLGPEPPDPTIPPGFRSFANKLANLATPFFSLSFMQMAVMGVGYGLSVAAFLVGNWRTLRADVLLYSAAVFLLLFVVFPYQLDGAGFVDLRWLLPAILLPFCATATGPVAPQRALLAVPFAAVLAHAAFMQRAATAIDGELASYRQVLNAVPPDARLLPLIVEPQWRQRLSPYRHFALWHTIEGGGRVPGLLSEENRYDTNPPALTHKFFGHFREPTILYYPDERWGTERIFPLDWPRIATDYDYVIEAGADSRTRAALDEHADKIDSAGDVALYRVRRGNGA
jgi:hypothetical protein